MKRYLAAPILACFLAACGGGGGSNGPVASTASFPLAAGYKALIQGGANYNFTISGTCGGSGTESVAPATTATTFEGSSALSAVTTQRILLTGCTPAASGSVSTTFHDPATFIPFGAVGTDYAVAQAKAAPLPATVKVGDSAAVLTLNVYADSSKRTLQGTRTAGYVVSADSASTALVTIIQKELTGATVTSTQQTTYRVSSDGSFSLVSIDVVAGATHLVLTKV